MSVALRLTAQTRPDIRRIGGKACGLVRLLAAGLSVPEAWCLCADLDDKAVEAALIALWAELSGSGEPLLAVRSSAVAEDLADASFAGVYETTLGVNSREQLIKAVRSCRAAVNCDAALVYRREKGIEGDVGMAVVVQRLIRAEVAGVLLTANPRRAFANEVVIDAAYGLGEGVVSGRVDPDHLVLDRDTGRVREERLGSKKMALRFDDAAGLCEHTTDDVDRQRYALSDTHVRRLHELESQVTARIGPRQDCEFAFLGDELSVLQVRPITGLPPVCPQNVFSRKFGDEYIADYCTPLSSTLLLGWIADYVFKEMAELADSADVTDAEPIRVYEGYAYFNGEYIRQMLRAVPRALRENSTQGWFTPLWSERLKDVPFSPRLFYSRFIKRPNDPRASLTENPKALERHCANIERTIVPKLALDLTTLSDAAWTAEFDNALATGVEHFRVIRWGMGQHNAFLHTLLPWLLRRWAGDEDGALYQEVVSGLPGTKTTAINRDVWRLGVAARADGELAASCRAGRKHDALRAAHAASPFWTAFDNFVATHGHRSASREISLPRWRDQPALVLGLVRAQLQSAEEPPDPIAFERAAVARRKAAEERALKRAGRGPGGRVRQRTLRWAMRQTQIFTRYRENQRYHLDYVLCHIRRLLLERGRRFVEAGVVNEAYDIFFMSEPEFRAALATPERNESTLARIRERQAHYERWKNRLPATYLFDDVETEGELAEGDPSSDHASASASAPTENGAGVGIGAARGEATGRLRVLSDISELGDVQPGDILVAVNIDPGWTNVFPLLNGIITETGGLLSHGALLAREYGIPAVMGIPNATTRFRSGEVVKLDGTAGTVTPEAPTAPRAVPIR